MQSSFAGESCFLAGELFTYSTKNGQSVSNLKDRIRLHLDADSVDKCQSMISAYCRYNILDKGYKPTKMTAYFKPNLDKPGQIEFEISEKCKVTKKIDD